MENKTHSSESESCWKNLLSCDQGRLKFCANENKYLDPRVEVNTDNRSSQDLDRTTYRDSLLPTFSNPPHRSPASYVYSTCHLRRGVCVVFSVDKFDPILCLPARNGAHIDVRNIHRSFSSLGFEVSVYSNLNCRSFLATAKNVASQNHKDCDCFACVILTHGDEGGLIYATDGAISLDQLIRQFRGDQCADLRGKPKLFFIQACRGTTLDEGVLVCDSPSTHYTEINYQPTLQRIPIEADLLIAYAVQSGYYAFRNSATGSWFVQALSDTLLRYGNTLDLLNILTYVNYTVAYGYESTALNPNFSGKKQMPSIVSTLTKQVIFPPKLKKLTPSENVKCR